MTGRPLREAYAAGSHGPGAGQGARFTHTGTGDYPQRLRIWEQGSRRYIDAGWID